MGGTVINTPRTLIENGYEVVGYCRQCRHSSVVDLEKVAARMGWDWDYIGKRWPLKCAACGCPDNDIRIHPPTKPPA